MKSKIRKGYIIAAKECAETKLQHEVQYKEQSRKYT